MTRAAGPSTTDARLRTALWAMVGRQVLVHRTARRGAAHPAHEHCAVTGTLTHVTALSGGRFIVELDRTTKLPCGGRDFPTWMVTPVEAAPFLPSVIA